MKSAKQYVRQIKMRKTLETLLKMTVAAKNSVTGATVMVSPGFIVSVQRELPDGGVHFIIHPDGYNGDTLDFVVNGNELEQI